MPGQTEKARIVIGPESHAMIGCEHDERRLVEAQLVQSVEQLAEEPIDELQLKQMTLARLLLPPVSARRSKPCRQSILPVGEVGLS